MLQLALPALLTALAGFPAPAPAEFPMTWAGEKMKLDELPGTLPESAQAAARTWAPWAEEVGYRMDFSADARVLLLTFDDNKGRKKSEKNMRLIEGVLEQLDTMLPLPASRSAEASATRADDGTFEWGSVARESQTAVLLELDDLDHHVSAVDFVMQQSEYLGAWGASAKGLTGFVLEQPLVAAWQPKAGIKVDWEGNPTNEMVNRLAQIMTLRRFGRQPYWLSVGIAWYVEMEQLDAVFCFPYRNSEFVSASEHTKWDKVLRNTLKRRKEPLEMSELTRLARGTFHAEASKMSWGAVAFLVRHHPGALPEICEELYRNWDEQGRVTNADGTWNRIDGYEPSEADQLAIFERQVPNFKLELMRFYVEGTKYKLPQ